MFLKGKPQAPDLLIDLKTVLPPGCVETPQHYVGYPTGRLLHRSGVVSGWVASGVMKTTRDHLHLKDGDRIITAYGESAYGPRWADNPLWVIIASRDGSMRQECLQPFSAGGCSDFTPEMFAIYEFSALAHTRMTAGC